MIARYRAFVELACACIALAAAGVTWAHTRSTVAVAPVFEGQPTMTSVIYHPAQLVLTLLLTTIAGIFTVVGMTRIARAKAA